jgi:hypothetical protein
MQELRFVAVSEDGRYAVLAVPGRSARFTLPIDERLRAVALGQTSRLAQYEIEVESPLRPKEIQARIRAGETVEEIADAAGIAVERVRWFEGPVLAERAYMADQAQRASVRRPGDAIPSSPGPRLGEIVAERLKVFGSDPEEAQWDARKLGDASWQVQLTFISGGRLHNAEWNFDPRRRHVVPADDNASRMSLPGGEPPQPAAPAPGEATVTHLAPRLSSAAGYGNGAMAGGAVGNGAGSGFGAGFGNGLGNGGRARHERPAPMRPAAPEPWIAEPRVTEPRVTEPRIAEPQTPEPRADEPLVGPAQTAGPQAAGPQAAGPQAAEPQAADPQTAEQWATGQWATEQWVIEPAVTEPEPEPREAEVPAAAAPQAPSAPPASPATVAAQVSRAVPTGPPGRPAQAPPSSHPARHARPPAQEPRVVQPHHDAPAPPAPPRAADAVTVSAPPVSAPPVAEPEAPAEPAAEAPSAPAAGEQSARSGRKTARGRRSSVPSWDEIMFGNSRQRD